MAQRIDIDSNVYEAALERADHILTIHDHVLVLFSGGKDSTAAMNIMVEAAQAKPEHARHLPLRVVHYDEEGVPYETEEYVRRTAQRPEIALEWYCLPLKSRNACSYKHPHWYPWAPEAKDKWCRPLPAEAITELPGFPIEPPSARLGTPETTPLLAPPTRGNTAVVMGIRAQESLIRTRAVLSKTVDNYLIPYRDGAGKAGNIWKAYPIYDWTADDIWTGVNALGWDYNAAYDLQHKVGLSPTQQRVSPPFGEQSNGSLHLYAQAYPDVWDKLCERVPGAGAAVRYHFTELYAHGKRPEKPESMPWPEFIANYISKHSAYEADLIRERMRTELSTHYRKTQHPVMPTAPHPATGVSWSFLAGIAMRGDFKGRLQAMARVVRDDTGRPVQRAIDKYQRELIAAIESGHPPAHYGHPGKWPDPDDLRDYHSRIKESK